ncbi:MAG: homospermidine synthase [Alphaproteobacteria bacterium]|nr:MAG: homospermidine synthase [Alphaproteobacteria bacterium]
MFGKIPFKGKILMIGFGSVGHCTMPLLLKHIDMPLDRIAVVDGDDHSAEIARYREMGVKYEVRPIVPGNMDEVLGAHLEPGGMLINLSVNVSSIDLMNWCQAHGCTYLDTCIEPWAHYYDNPDIPMEERTNYYLRHLARENGRKWGEGSPTAIVTHGANPGLISHFVKAALLEIARDKGLDATKPSSREGWATLMRDCGTKVIHVAEHDTQIASQPKRPGEFVNTWSIPGFWGEGMQPAELGWGTHEKELPPEGREHETGNRGSIFLNRPGMMTEVRSWTPIGGPMIGFCITHGESITIPDYFSVWENGKVVYRPTVHYAYHPCNDAVLSARELVMSGFKVQPRARLLGREITEGIDELGALLMGDHGALWYGSQLSIGEARQLLGPEFNATSIQIAAPVLAGAIWMIRNPDRGYTEPEDIDHDFVLDICKPYLGPVVAERSDWTPLKDRGVIFEEPHLDYDDHWQFKNFRVT